MIHVLAAPLIVKDKEAAVCDERIVGNTCLTFVNPIPYVCLQKLLLLILYKVDGHF